jgi:dihydrodipicolinate synthase/N-acetylneuraminate lyase
MDEHISAIVNQAQQERMARDTKIMQKVNQANREAFTQRFPGQIQHCMRLVAERLQAVLTRKPADLTDPETWTATAQEIRELTEALHYLSLLNRAYPLENANV